MTTNVLESETSRYQYTPDTVSWSILSLKCYSTAEINVNCNQSLHILIDIFLKSFLDFNMGEADPVDQPLVEPVEGEEEVFVEEIKAIRDLLEKNHPVVSGLEDRVQERKAKAKENVQHIERTEGDVELAIELADRV